MELLRGLAEGDEEEDESHTDDDEDSKPMVRLEGSDNEIAD